MVFRPGGPSLTRVEQENCCSSLCSLDVFQTLKGSLQTYVAQRAVKELESFKPSKDRYKPGNWYEFEFISCGFQTLKGSLQTVTPLGLSTLFLRVSNPQRIATNVSLLNPLSPGTSCFKPSKDRYKLRLMVQFLQILSQFQTLKGSLQTVILNLHFHFRLYVSNPQRIATNPVLKRICLTIQHVSNPQRIATNTCCHSAYQRTPFRVSNPQRIATN